MRFIATAVVVTLHVISSAEASASPESRRWQAPEVQLHLAPSQGLAQADVLDVVRGACETWNDVGTGPLLVLADGPPPAAEVAYDGVNAVFFVETAWSGTPDQLALTYSHVDANTGEVLEVDMAINAARYRFTVGEPELGAFDLQNLFTHELGHALGLGHLEGEESTMFAEIQERETGKRALDAADVDAVLALYEGIDGGSIAGCRQAGGEVPTFALLVLVITLFRRSRRLPHLA